LPLSFTLAQIALPRHLKRRELQSLKGRRRITVIEPSFAFPPHMFKPAQGALRMG